MKTKFNLVGNTFTHLSGGNKGYSVHGKESKHIEWVREGGEATFYVDDAIVQGCNNDWSIPKYGWLLESKWISGAVAAVKADPDEYLDQYTAVFTHDQELLKLSSRFKFVPAQGFWIKDPKVYPKTKLISMISSNKAFCKGHRERLQLVEKLRDHVDLYGRGFNPIEFKEEGLCDYMFSVAIENGQYETYFTEKILDCFATGTIPVYRGAPDIGNYFNMDGIIVLSKTLHVSQELYESKKDAVLDNLERVKKMEVLEDYIWENYFQ